MAGKGNPEWTKGKSGNPLGRPKVQANVREAYEKALDGMVDHAMKRLRELMDSDHAPTAMAATREVIERKFGKVAQAVEAGGNVKIEIILNEG